MKALKIIFYSLIVGFYILTLLNGIYLSLGEELQESISFLSPVSAVISGLSFGGVATLMLFVDKKFITKEQEQDIKHSELITAFTGYIKNNKGDNTKLFNMIEKLFNATERNNRLLEVSLGAKLDNEFLEKQARELIEGVLNEK